MFLHRFHYLLLILSTALLAHGTVNAEEKKQESPKNQTQIDFYSARTLDTNSKGQVEIMVAGRASVEGVIQPQTGQSITLIQGENITNLKYEEAFQSGKAETSTDGRFEFLLVLPNGQMQVPLVFKANNGETQVILLTLNVEAGEVNLANEKKDFNEWRNHIWFGAGINYLSLDQSFEIANRSDLKFESFTGPEFSLGYSHFFSDRYRMSLEVRNSPGETKSNSQITVTKGDYSWQAVVLDNAFFMDRNYPMKLYLGWKGRMQYRLGFQYHVVPYLRWTTTSTVEVKEENLGFVTAGLGYEAISPQRLWKTDIFLRYQQVVMGGSDITASSVFAFEGLIGINRMVGDHWMIGGQWNGQYLQFSYTGLQDTPTSSTANGKLKMLHSLMEIRMAYMW